MAFRAIVPAMVSRRYVSVVTDKTVSILKGNSQTDWLNVKEAAVLVQFDFTTLS